MEPSSRTHEVEPNQCPVCSHRIILDTSGSPFAATCPHCGCLLWFDRNGSLTADRSLSDKSEFKGVGWQIRSLVAQIESFSRSNITDEEFYRQFLPRVVSALAAPSGSIWMLNSEGQLALLLHIGIRETGLSESREHLNQHSHLLYRVCAVDRNMLVPPHAWLGDQDQVDGEMLATNPTDFLLLFGLMKTDRQTVGLVEIFQRPEAPPLTQRGYLRFLTQMCELAHDFLNAVESEGIR